MSNGESKSDNWFWALLILFSLTLHSCMLEDKLTKKLDKIIEQTKQPNH